MKIIFISLVIIFQSITVLGQIDVLDEKNGFKSIKLGTDITQFQNLRLLDKVDKSFERYFYEPIDEDLYYVFNDKFDVILLLFSNNILISIDLVKVHEGDNFYQKALNNCQKTQDKFIQVLGKANRLIDEDFEHYDSVGLAWFAKSTFLEVSTYYFGISRGQAEVHVKFGKTSNLRHGF